MSRFRTILVATRFLGALRRRARSRDRAGARVRRHACTCCTPTRFPSARFRSTTSRFPQSMLDAVRDAAARRIEKSRAKAEAAGVACQVAPHGVAAHAGDRRHRARPARRSDRHGNPRSQRLPARPARQQRRAHRPAGALPGPDAQAERRARTAKFARILAPVDFSKQGEAALALAIELAREHEAELHLLHAYDLPAGVAMGYGGAIPQSVWDGIEAGARASLEKAREPVKSAGVPFKTHLAIGPATDAILETAKAETCRRDRDGHPRQARLPPPAARQRRGAHAASRDAVPCSRSVPKRSDAAAAARVARREPRARGGASARSRRATGRAFRVEWVQTHLSHVFLTPTRVYKLRKAVDARLRRLLDARAAQRGLPARGAPQPPPRARRLPRHRADRERAAKRFAIGPLGVDAARRRASTSW